MSVSYYLTAIFDNSILQRQLDDHTLPLSVTCETTSFHPTPSPTVTNAHCPTAMCLQVCEDEYKQQLAENRVTDDVKFTYSWHLIKSQYKNDIKKGIRLMDGKSWGGRWREVGRRCEEMEGGGERWWEVERGEGRR